MPVSFRRRVPVLRDEVGVGQRRVIDDPRITAELGPQRLRPTRVLRTVQKDEERGASGSPDRFDGPSVRAKNSSFAVSGRLSERRKA